MLFFGDIERLPLVAASGARFKPQARKIATCTATSSHAKLTAPKAPSQVADAIRRLASQWEHPLAGLWVVETTFKAQDIRSALLAHMDAKDRLYITEAGRDKAESNAMPASGAKVTPIGPVMQVTEVQGKNRMLTAIFSRSGKRSRHLTAATAENLKSA